MRIDTTFLLLIAILAIAVAVAITTEFRLAGRVGWTLSTVVAYAAFFANLGLSVVGFRTPQRRWWIANAVASVAAMVLIGAPTVPGALWTLGRIWWS